MTGLMIMFWKETGQATIKELDVVKTKREPRMACKVLASNGKNIGNAQNDTLPHLPR
jgi:hypothetical protein